MTDELPDPAPFLTVPTEEPRPGSADPSGAEPRLARYVIREADGERYLCCVETPEVRVVFSREAVIQEAAARKAPPGTIFVDGAASAPPFLDPERGVYNLDHHEGCARPFTLAACEQALVLVFRGLDVSERPWTVRAAEPDLDALLAVWVLLNAGHLQRPVSLPHRRLIPLIRLESVIDSHGLALAELSGLAPEQLEEATRSLESLRVQELALKREGAWGSADLLEYAAGVLQQVDDVVFPPGSLPRPVDFEVLARSSLGNGSLVLVCRAEEGIYEMESTLQQIYGRRLALLALETAPKRFTLRLVDPFSGIDLEAIYEELNTLDAAVAAGGWRNRWGGSGEIGGSPRRSGTSLQPADIAQACSQAMRRPSPARRLMGLAGAVLFAALAILGGLASSWLAGSPLALPPALNEPIPPALGFAVVGAALLLSFGFRRPHGFGLRLFAPGDWLFCVPVAFAASVAGGNWTAGADATVGAGEWLITSLCLAIGAESLFRGAVHGVLRRTFRVSHAGGRWFLSLPTLTSSLLFAATGSILGLSGPTLLTVSPQWQQVASGGAALVLGVALGLIRERSGSLAAAATVLVLSTLASWFLM